MRRRMLHRTMVAALVSWLLTLCAVSVPPFLAYLVAASAYDNDTQSLNLVATNTTTFSHTAAGSERAITVCVMLTGTTQTVSSITYGGTGLSSIGSGNFGAVGRIEAWGLAASATGANNVVVTLSAANAAWDASAVSYTGANQSGGTSTFNGFQSAGNASGSDTSIAVTVTSTTNDLVSDCALSVNGNGTTSSPGTQRWQDNSGLTNTQGQTAAGATTVTTTETYDSVAGTTNQYNLVGFNVVGSGAGTTSTPTLTLLGVGPG